MIKVIPFASLGSHEFGWLNAHYHFSFSNYNDPTRMGYRPLRVWNDDQIKPGGGFPMHPHNNMEIITYVIKGAITHKDSLGHEGVIKAGYIQIMSAGSGIIHSEHNCTQEETHLFQIWIEPNKKNIQPRWESSTFPKEEGKIQIVASGRKKDIPKHLPKIYQDVAFCAAKLHAGQSVQYSLSNKRHVYLVLVKGDIIINNKEQLFARDGCYLVDIKNINIIAHVDSEFVMVDMKTLD